MKQIHLRELAHRSFSNRISFFFLGKSVRKVYGQCTEEEGGRYKLAQQRTDQR